MVTRECVEEPLFFYENAPLIRLMSGLTPACVWDKYGLSAAKRICWGGKDYIYV
jgi:hypothetical protein